MGKAVHLVKDITMSSSVTFAPQLYIGNGVHDIGFYERAFNAKEIQRWTNDDGSIHVAELSIGGALFHLHEEASRKELKSPHSVNGSTVLIGLFVPDVDLVMQSAIAAGAVEVSPAQDYDYGYRQGMLRDPFGHEWMIEKKLASWYLSRHFKK